ncbi:MAG: hypothetical protein U5K71_12870 [Gracilimonas sp.]|nr:hypothetical protein [Gracilimonas sp.]
MEGFTQVQAVLLTEATIRFAEPRPGDRGLAIGTPHTRLDGLVGDRSPVEDDGPTLDAQIRQAREHPPLRGIYYLNEQQ